MEKTTAIMELLAGYEAYSDARELNVTAAAEAPATSPACIASATASFVASQFSAKTVAGGC
ncbi:LxmA leader domain family RiPP [Streptomyces kebangsaanensis]|uniref:LxmA leader domain family RiPP n=1 Tax=Streptomyces kebangsaanensis TaxID=864058 RepID=A0ABW6KS62_9ACTN|nr:LxmA leader domain family RiPP [Streptomyces kebangsaanensis]